MTDQPVPFKDRLAWKLALVGLVAAVVCFWDLGGRGLTNSEGHRVVPAAEYIERWHAGEFQEDPAALLMPTMFDTPYMRKPPGFPWAIAVVSAVFSPDGLPNEWTARSVSATSGVLMALLGGFFGHRWFKAGLASGLATALLPTALSSYRSAEIEATNNLVTMAAVVTGISLLTDMSRRRWAWTVGFGLSIVAVVLVKGPASLPVVVAVVAGATIARRNPKVVLKEPRLWLAVAGAALVLAPFAIVFLMRASSENAVSQGVDDFLFEPGRLAKVAALPFVSFVYQLPVAIAPLFAFGPFASKEANDSERAWRKTTIARALAWAWVLSLLIYTLSGVSNPRYTLPAACLPALATGYVVRGMTEWFVPLRRYIARACTMGLRAAWLVPMIGFAVGYIAIEEPKRAEESGRAAGLALGEALAALNWDEPITVLADNAIEARPEVLWYAERRAGELGTGVKGLWEADRLVVDDSAAAAYGRAVLLLRDDSRGSEADRLAEHTRWQELWSGEAGHFRFRAFIVDSPIEPVPSPSAGFNEVSVGE